MTSKIIYLDPFSILVVNKQGKLVRAHCPFLARSLLDKENKFEVVEMVFVKNDLEFNFLINGKKSNSKNWDIVL
jgi:hypothetical protein